MKKKITPNEKIEKTLTVEQVKQAMVDHLQRTVGKERMTATDRDWFDIVAYTVRDKLAEYWIDTMRSYYDEDVKRVYYLSLEFLMGRTLVNTMLNLGIYDKCLQAIEKQGVSASCIYDLEQDPALGNGGLGRLAACFLDSLATLGLPGYGYGIRYEFGMFYQRLRDGYQVEHPDNWLRYGNPWEFPRAEVLYRIKFGGHVVEYTNAKGKPSHHWEAAEDVMAMAYDTPIPGYNTKTANNMRLWAAKASRDFDLNYFNQGNYIKAVEDKNRSENLSKVLYPNDTTEMGRELRLRQEYFFVSASVRDIVRRYMKTHPDIHDLPDKVAIQLNDTHPALAIPELMHILMDETEDKTGSFFLEWEEAWAICTRVFSYTNHTLLPEALETWPVPLFEQLLPRHLQIIYEINHRFLKDVTHQYPGDIGMMRRMSLIGEEGIKHVRMAHLAFVGSHKVNGVAALHTELMKTTIFADFHHFYPDRIVNKTNGITPRRWLNQANHSLSDLITQYIGSGWQKDLMRLKRLAPLIDDKIFCHAFRAVKRANKERLADYIARRLHIDIDVDSMFDVQVKRIHEYKRQLLNLLHVITHYNHLRHHPEIDMQPRTVIFAGKAAPGYFIAKLIIKLINDVADVVNNDPHINDRLKVVFIPNYDVSTAELIIPAADLSEQISTAGMEASGTGNMKFALNGALTIGTLDGANIEIREEVGEDNFFLFGLTAEQVHDLRQHHYNPWEYIDKNQDLKQVLTMIETGFFSPEEPDRFKAIVDTLTHDGDYFMLLADYEDYIRCQKQVDKAYKESDAWTRKAILNVANMGKFSSDRTIQEYADEIWHAVSLERD